MESKLLEYLEELWSREDYGENRKDWIFGAIMAAREMGVISMATKHELLIKYGMKKPE